MGKKKSKSQKSSAQAQAKERKRAIVVKTLNEIISHLVDTDHTAEAQKLKSVMEQIDEKEIVSHLEDPESPLFDAVPVDVLKETEDGRASLDVLSDLTSMEQLTLEQKMQHKAKGDLGSALMGNVTLEIPEEIKSLAADLQKELELPDEIENIADIDMSDLFAKVSALMEQKTQRGEVDIAKLHTQSKRIMQEAESSPLFKTLLSNPEALQGMMGGLGGPSGK